RKKIISTIFAYLIFVSCSHDASLETQKIQGPRPEGFGSFTPGGTCKNIVHVPTLDSAGPGSLHDAIGSDRIIVFDVAGTINKFEWDSSNEFPVFNLTIDGSTAPAPGI